MTVFVYVNTKQVGDPDHLKVSRMPTLRKPGWRTTTRKAWPLSTR
jgi:hypothetical protein